MTKEELKKEAEEWLCNNLHSASEEDFIKAMVEFAEPREKRIAELEHQLTHRNCLDCSNHSSNLRMRNLDLEKENAELKEENQKWKDEWQEQVQKATDEGYARTLQTIQLTKAKEIIKIFLKYEICTLNIKEELADNIAKAEQFISEVEKC
jgi:hypothetical protein